MDGNWPPHDCHQRQQNVSDSSNPPHQLRQRSQMSDSDEDAGDEDESESSALTKFRRLWEAELKQTSNNSQKNNTPTSNLSGSSSVGIPSNITPTTTTCLSPVTFSPRHRSPAPLLTSSGSQATASSLDRIEEEARKLFLMGVGFERRGDLYDAVRYYRRAMQLIPDIEYRVQQSDVREYESPVEAVQEDVRQRNSRSKAAGSDDNEDEDNGESLYKRFLSHLGETNNWKFFDKFKEDTKGHISDLPVEILLYIMRWVVSSDLDVRSLDTLAAVSSGFYCLSRDEKLWKMACDRVWSSCDILGSEYLSYRNMFHSRPRVRYDGCYISRVTYVRPGEHSFQDASYRPWHIVEYFRYLRFFPDGTIYFLTTSDKPGITVGSLRDRSARNPTILKGSYHLFGHNIISASVSKISPVAITGRSGKIKSKPDITDFHMDFEIEELKGRNNWVLRWTYYSVYINKSKGRANNPNNNNAGEHGGISTAFELSPSKYPPLYFSRVKSYTLNAEEILE